MTHTSGRAILWMAGAAVFGAALMLWVTRWGAGTEPDSVIYIAAARRLAEGQGMTVPSWQGAEWVPMTHFPPLFPAVLGALHAFGIDAWDAARLVNAVVFGATVGLMGLVLARATRHKWLAVVGVLGVLNSVHLIDVHVMAMSEGLFLLLSLACLAVLGRYLERPGRRALLGAAALAGAAFLTRYVGVALIGGALAALLLTGGRRWRRRVTDCVAFVLVSTAPMALWILRNTLVAHNAANRHVQYHPITAEHFRTGLLTISRWFMPQSLPEAVRLAGAAGAVVVLAALTLLPARRTKDDSSAPAGQSRRRLAG